VPDPVGPDKRFGVRPAARMYEGAVLRRGGGVGVKEALDSTGEG
jgi:hypothetical protein